MRQSGCCPLGRPAAGPAGLRRRRGAGQGRGAGRRPLACRRARFVGACRRAEQASCTTACGIHPSSGRRPLPWATHPRCNEAPQMPNMSTPSLPLWPTCCACAPPPRFEPPLLLHTFLLCPLPCTALPVPCFFLLPCLLPSPSSLRTHSRLFLFSQPACRLCEQHGSAPASGHPARGSLCARVCGILHAVRGAGWAGGCTGREHARCRVDGGGSRRGGRRWKQLGPPSAGGRAN